ncbi:MAG: cyclic dehypoxanthinyl futalosine synthase [Planctomycetota bacterium]|nr:cyclic dehypoxanthinyl futalosine synthase [Planctomycetota bacterium]
MQAAGKQERDGAIVEKLCKEIGERRLSLEEWSQLLPEQEDGLLELGVPDEDLFALADRSRCERHPDDVVTYIIDRNISYTNICTSICNFCAFYVSPGQEGGYVLSHEEIFRKVEETLELGGSGILFQGGLHPDLQLDWYTDLFSELKSRYGIHLHCLSPTEILGLQEVSGLSSREILSALKDSGMDSMPGGGGEILVDEVRSKRRSKVNSKEWLDIMETAQELGLPTTATMMFGHGEKLSDRLQHLEKIRQLQDRTGGFVSFILWNFQPDNTPLGRIYPERMEAAEYLRWLALSRIYLDNIDNLQVSWLTQGLEVGKQALRCGANDMGSVMIEENVIKPAGANHEATGEMLREAITEAGFRPTLRNAAYRRLEDAASLS